MLDKYIPGGGAIGAKLMIIGEAPSFAEVEAGRPFVGPAGRQLDHLIKDAGFSRAECWLTNVSKFFVPFSPKKGKKIPFLVRAKQAGVDMDQQISELYTEIQEVNPNCLLILGGTALEALSKKDSIQDYRGSIIQVAGKKAVSTYHPASLIHQGESEATGYWVRQVMVFDMQRAYAQSKFPDFRLPYRNLQVCRSSAQLEDWYTRLKAERKKRGLQRIKVGIDIEALECIPSCIGFSFNWYEGLTVPLWNVKGISNIPDSDLASVWLLLATILSDEQIHFVGQNFKYDEDKLNRLRLRIWKLYSDTMLKAFAINPELPKNLAFNTSIYTEEPFYKNEGMYEGSMQDLFIGCARDACVTLEVDDKMDKDLDELGLRPFYDNFLMKLHYLYLDIEQQGFKVNEEKRAQLLKKYIEWDEGINYELFQIVGSPINTQSWKQVQTLLYHNWAIPGAGSTSEEVLTQILNSKRVKDPAKRRGIELILESRRVKKTIQTYAMALPDYDGRMRTTYFLCLETGRTSTGQQDAPIRPTFEYKDIDGKKKKKSLGAAFQVMTKHGDIGQDIRSMYEADAGEVFIQADSAQAEARVISLLADDQEALAKYDEPGRDVHAETASWFFGGTEADYSKKILGYESPKRFAGKTLKHAANLGASKRRAAIEVNTQARKYKINFVISEEAAGMALEIFHARTPKVRGVFHKGIIECLEKNLRTLVAPLPYGIDAPFGGKRTFYERWGEELFRQAFSYLPQRAVSDNTKAAALRIKQRAPWIRIIMESHDSLLCSVPVSRLNEAALILREELERPINFHNCSIPRGYLKIPCEVEYGFNYMQLKKYKIEEVAA